jgi:hypothetical protein
MATCDCWSVMMNRMLGRWRFGCQDPEATAAPRNVRLLNDIGMLIPCIIHPAANSVMR